MAQILGMYRFQPNEINCKAVCVGLRSTFYFGCAERIVERPPRAGSRLGSPDRGELSTPGPCRLPGQLGRGGKEYDVACDLASLIRREAGSTRWHPPRRAPAPSPAPGRGQHPEYDEGQPRWPASGMWKRAWHAVSSASVINATKRAYILGGSAASPNYHRPSGLQTTQMYFLQFWKPERPRSRRRRSQGLVRATFRVHT